MSIDLYESRRMAEALRQMKPARSFLRQLCVRRDEESDTEKVDVDIQSGARRLAPYVNPKSGTGKVVNRIGYTTDTYTAPMVAPKRPITAEDLRKRLPGESIYSPQGADSREAQLLGEDLADLDEQITRVEERQVSEGAFSSQVTVSGDDVSEVISFARSAECVHAAPGASAANGLGTASPTSTKLTTARVWDASTADIPTQIRQMRRLYQKKTGVSPDFMVLGEEAADALLKAPSLVGTTGLLNTQRMDLGQIKPELRDGGATYLGMFAGTGVDLWAYDEWYIDPADGVEKPMAPAKLVLMGSTKAYAVMRYGAVPVASGIEASSKLSLLTGKRVPESWINKEPAVRFLKVSSRPLFVPVQNDAFITCQVLA
jgi:hypothetical protein